MSAQEGGVGCECGALWSRKDLETSVAVFGPVFKTEAACCDVCSGSDVPFAVRATQYQSFHDFRHILVSLV